MPKLYIKNRKDQNISVIIEEHNSPKWLAFVMHGLGWYKEQIHVETFARALKDSWYSIIRFDTTNTFWESDWEYENATVTNYYEDLEDVINWGKNQSFYKEPFVLCGHSLGWICTALYAEKHPNQVKALAPISTVVSWELSKEKYSKNDLENWEKTGRYIKKRSNGDDKRLKWSHLLDRVQYDLLVKADRLTMPVLMIVWDLDESTPVEHQ